MEQIAQGAEARIFMDGDTVVKDRFEKRYRHPELDRKLRKSRTRREAKVLSKLTEIGVAAPQLVEMDDKEMKVVMEKVPGDMVKQVVDALEEKGDAEGYRSLFKEIGMKIALMHNAGIIHHDLTTSNMILHSSKKKVYLIDFGLSFFSEKVEDKAVDLHLLKHAIESRHYKIVDDCFNSVMDGYRQESNELKEVLNRFEKVEARGRNKSKH